MSYTYNPGDGLAALDATKPNGATEPGSVLDDAIRQIKAFLKDTSAPQSNASLKTALDVVAAAVGAAGAKNTFVAYTNANQVIPSGSPAETVEFNAETLDPDGVFTPASFRFTAPVAGFYFFSTSLRVDILNIAAPTGISHRVKFLVNGVPAAEAEYNRGTTTDGETFPLNRCLQLAAGALVTVVYEPTVGGGSCDFQVTADSIKTVFEGFRIA